jgi:hypothetical protein
VRGLALAGALAAGMTTPAAAHAVQQAAPPVQDIVATAGDDDDPLTVYLVTAAPGEAVWERFGHNALWIHDARTGEDVVWNWGLFSFSQAGFIPRLVRGEMMYWMGGFPLEATLGEYRAQGRDVWAQELALTPEQELELDRLVRLNALPENRFYRYDYYRDNCSTRVRDMLDAVLGGAIRSTFEPVETGVSWRWHTLRLLDETPVWRTGLQIVLGNPGDERIDAWQEMFLPMRLRARVADMTVDGPDGTPRALVVAERRLLEGALPAPRVEPRSRAVAFLLAGLVVGGGVLVLARAAAGGARGARWSLAALLVVWGVVAGVVGVVLTAAYLTDHVFWFANENLLLATPLHLGVGTAGLMLFQRRSAPRWTVALARLLAGLSLFGLALKPLPGFDQGNADILAFALPINVAAAVALAWMARARGWVPAPGAEAATGVAGGT